MKSQIRNIRAYSPGSKGIHDRGDEIRHCQFQYQRLGIFSIYFKKMLVLALWSEQEKTIQRTFLTLWSEVVKKIGHTKFIDSV